MADERPTTMGSSQPDDDEAGAAGRAPASPSADADAAADDDEGCPKNDPACEGGAAGCHDACERPTTTVDGTVGDTVAALDWLRVARVRQLVGRYASAQHAADAVAAAVEQSYDPRFTVAEWVNAALARLGGLSR